MIGAVVGIGIPITRLLGKCKPGQNRSARDRLGAVQVLRDEVAPAARESADLKD